MSKEQKETELFVVTHGDDFYGPFTENAANKFMMEGYPGHFEPNDDDLNLWPLIRPPLDKTAAEAA